MFLKIFKHEQIIPLKLVARQIQICYIVIFLLGYILATFQLWRLNIYMNNTESVKENEVTVICVESKTDPKFSICPYQKEDDMHVSRLIREKGVWDHVLTKLLQIAFSLYKGSIFIDSGANIGYFSFYAGALGHDVLAIEPFSASFRKIRQGLALNEFSGNFKLLNNALSNKRSIVRMGEPMKLNKGHVIVDKEDLINSKRMTVVEGTIEAMTMDDLLKYLDGNEAILKMDIEGYECKAFGKSSALFQTIFVPYIFMEWLQIQANMNERGTACSEEAARNLVNYLQKLGYTPISYNPVLKLLDPHDMMDWIVYDIFWQHQNATSLLPFIDFISRE